MAGIRTGKWRRVALLLLACALLLKFPAGWMPEANAKGFTLGWCNALSPSAAAEGQKLFQEALGKKPAHEPQHAGDDPCPFAAAAMPLPMPSSVPISRRVGCSRT